MTTSTQSSLSKITDILRARTPGRLVAYERDTSRWDGRQKAVIGEAECETRAEPHGLFVEVQGAHSENANEDARAVAVSVNLAEPLLAMWEAAATLMERSPFVPDGETSDEWCWCCEALEPKHKDWCWFVALQASLATLEAKATEEVG